MSEGVNLTKCRCDEYGATCVEHATQFNRSFRVEMCYVPVPSGRVELGFIPPHDDLAAPDFERHMPWAPLMRKHSAERMAESFNYWCGFRAYWIGYR